MVFSLIFLLGKWLSSAQMHQLQSGWRFEGSVCCLDAVAVSLVDMLWSPVGKGVALTKETRQFPLNPLPLTCCTCLLRTLHTCNISQDDVEK